MSYYPENSAIMCLLPLSMRMAGPRALWHALMKKLWLYTFCSWT